MLASAIRDAAATRFSDSAFVIYQSADWLEYVNDAYMMVWGASPWWPWKRSRVTVTISANARSSSALANGVWRVEAVRDDTNDNVLVPLMKRTDYGLLDPSDDASGPPVVYRLYNNTIEVWPRPTVSTSLKVDVLLQGTALLVGDAPVFPEQYHRMLVDGALMLAYADDGNGAMAKFYSDRFDRKLAQMQTDLLDNQEEGFTVVTDDFWQGTSGF